MKIILKFSLIFLFCFCSLWLPVLSKNADKTKQKTCLTAGNTILILREFDNRTDISEKLSKIRNIHFENYQGKELPGFIANCKNLEEIFIDENIDFSLKKLFNLIKDLNSLNSLIFSNLKIKIPNEFPKLNNLKTLAFHNVYSLNKKDSILKLDKVLYRFKNLKSLALTHLKLGKVPDIIYQIISLKNLDLSFNRISELSPQIINLKNLEILRLANNDIQEIPENTKELTHLRICNLDSNVNLNFKHAILILSKLDSLKALTISKIKTFSFPLELLLLRNLELLSLNDNCISEIPENIETLAKLNTLWLTNNKIKNVDNIFRLKSLQNLYLDGNQITRFPHDLINNKSHLANIQIYNNPITAQEIERIRKQFNRVRILSD